LDTLLYAALVVAVCLLLGYPLSYVIARSGGIGTAILAVVVTSSFSGTVTRILITQASTNPRLGHLGLNLLRAGLRRATGRPRDRRQ
jgi:ABC-type spermidine/putrescine transport system permease subunit I